MGFAFRRITWLAHIQYERCWVLWTKISFVVGNCAVFARMARDFGDDTLPTNDNPEEFLRTSDAPYFQISRWEIVTHAMEHLLRSCISAERHPKPGWSALAGNIVVVIVPFDSEFREEWWRSNSELGGTNVTGLLSSS